jgi:hypothetical protein
MSFNPTISKPRPWFEAKLKAGKSALSAWTAWTGTGSRASVAVGSATAADCAAAIKSLIDDLKTRGVIN